LEEEAKNIFYLKSHFPKNKETLKKLQKKLFSLQIKKTQNLEQLNFVS